MSRTWKLCLQPESNPSTSPLNIAGSIYLRPVTGVLWNKKFIQFHGWERPEADVPAPHFTDEASQM